MFDEYSCAAGRKGIRPSPFPGNSNHARDYLPYVDRAAPPTRAWTPFLQSRRHKPSPSATRTTRRSAKTVCGPRKTGRTSFSTGCSSRTAWGLFDSHRQADPRNWLARGVKVGVATFQQELRARSWKRPALLHLSANPAWTGCGLPPSWGLNGKPRPGHLHRQPATNLGVKHQPCRRGGRTRGLPACRPGRAGKIPALGSSGVARENKRLRV